MLKIYNTNLESNKLDEVEEIKKGCWINLVNPSEEEIKIVCDKIHIEDEYIKYALDYEEKARIDIDDDQILFIIDTPIIEIDEKNQGYTYSTMPIGFIVVRDDFFITISLKENNLISFFEKGKMKTMATYKKSRFILQLLYKNSEYFLNYLKNINKETENAEALLKDTMHNRELLKMLSLKKSLVYFRTSLKSNELVMEKTKRGRVVKLYEEDEDLLEDAIIENKQAIEMSKIYTDILTSTMEAYESIISNNLNDVMKFLTAVTIILAVPTMIASFWGMNVGLPFSNNIHGFVILIAISLTLTFVVTWWLKKKDMLD